MREGQPSRALPGYLYKEILTWYDDGTVQPGKAMTVKEMGSPWKHGEPFSCMRKPIRPNQASLRGRAPRDGWHG